MMNAAISDNKFLKVLIAAKRAKQINKGANPLVQSSSTRATRIALEEVELGLIRFDFTSEELDLNSGHDNRVDSKQDDKGNREAPNRPSVAGQLLAARLGD